MKNKDFKHGRTGYQYHTCRCWTCCNAQAEYSQTRRARLRQPKRYEPRPIPEGISPRTVAFCAAKRLCSWAFALQMREDLVQEVELILLEQQWTDQGELRREVSRRLRRQLSVYGFTEKQGGKFSPVQYISEMIESRSYDGAIRWVMDRRQSN